MLELSVQALDAATEAGDKEEIDKQSRRLVKVTPSHVEEAKKLLTLMGVPFYNVSSSDS